MRGNLSARADDVKCPQEQNIYQLANIARNVNIVNPTDFQLVLTNDRKFGVPETPIEDKAWNVSAADGSWLSCLILSCK